MFISQIGNIEPVYIELDGWNEDISQCNMFENLPKNAQKYVKQLEVLLDHMISYIGVGDKIHQYIAKS